MRKLAVAVLVMGMCLFSLHAEAGYDLAKYFPLDQGNRWVYKGTYIDEEGKGPTFEQTVTIEGVEKVDGKETIKMLISNIEQGEKDEEYLCIAMDAEGLKVYKNISDDSDTDYKPALLLFPAQLKMGSILEFSSSLTEYEFDEATSTSASSKKKFTLQGLEDISVKSGDFKDCLKFSINEAARFTNGDVEISNWVVWLAPNVGKVKEIRASISFEIGEEQSSESRKEIELEYAVIGGRRIGE